MIITTTNIIENQNITQYLGLVNANQVIGTSFLSDGIAAFSDFFGGMSGTYREQMNELYRHVIGELEKRATALGADAIIALSIDFDEISGKGKGMFMVSAIGTAVKLSPDGFAIYDKLHKLKLYESEGIITRAEYFREERKLRACWLPDIQKETSAIQRECEEKAAEEAMLLQEEALRLKNAEIQKQLSLQQQKILEGISAMTEYCGLKVNDLIEIVETGDMTTIDGFTDNGRIVCHINGEIVEVDPEGVRVVS